MGSSQTPRRVRWEHIPAEEKMGLVLDDLDSMDGMIHRVDVTMAAIKEQVQASLDAINQKQTRLLYSVIATFTVILIDVFIGGVSRLIG